MKPNYLTCRTLQKSPAHIEGIVLFFLFLIFVGVVPARSEDCQMGEDIDAPTKTALERTAKEFFQFASSGDGGSLKQNSVPAVASDFGGIQSAISDNKDNLSGASATTRGVYLLVANGNGALQRAEFFCGIFNSPDRVGFVLNNLPAGRYALVIEDVKGGKNPMALSFILQEMAGSWKLAGFQARATALGGHDAAWYTQQAQQYKAKGQSHDAWFYYLTAWDLAAPVPFMSTAKLDKLWDEAQQSKPADLPGDHPLQLSSGGKTYQVTQLFATPVNGVLDLVVKYQSADISNRAQVFADNMAVIKGIVAKYPELREAFDSIVARAVDPSGQDYGSLLAMKDVK